MFLKLFRYIRVTQGFLKHILLGFIPRLHHSVGLGCGLKICIFNKFLLLVQVPQFEHLGP